MSMTQITLGEMTGGGIEYTTGTMTPNQSSFTEVDLGFEPTRVVLFFSYIGSAGMILDYDVVNNKLYRTYNVYHTDLTSAYVPSVLYVSGTKLYYKAGDSSYVTTTEYIAIKE